LDISQQGVEFIKSREGFDGTAYKDSAGYWTIGYGHKIKPGDPYSPYTTMKADEALALLERDLQPVVACINHKCTAQLTQNQFDALCAFTFNVGCGAFETSTLLRRLNAGDFGAAAQELLRWDHAGGREVQGLLNRREAERDLFLS